MPLLLNVDDPPVPMFSGSAVLTATHNLSDYSMVAEFRSFGCLIGIKDDSRYRSTD
jgi:hypothetical protein